MKAFVLYTVRDSYLQLPSAVSDLADDSTIVLKSFTSHAAITEAYYLFAGINGIELWKQGDKRGVVVDEHKVIARASFANDLAKACGVTNVQQPEVVDVMSGYGVDGATLALLGAKVECWELLPGVALMAQDLMLRCGLEQVAALLE